MYLLFIIDCANLYLQRVRAEPLITIMDNRMTDTKSTNETLLEKALAVLQAGDRRKKSHLQIHKDEHGLWVGYFDHNDVVGRVAWYWLIQKDCFYETNYRTHWLDSRPFADDIYDALRKGCTGCKFPITSLCADMVKIAKLYDFDIGVNNDKKNPH